MSYFIFRFIIMISDEIRFSITLIKLITGFIVSSDSKLTSPQSNKWLRNSKHDPRLISRNLAKSFSENLAEPSAMLAGIEIAHLLIWDVNPNRSSTGSVLVR